jgi:serine/threonine-protein kinase
MTETTLAGRYQVVRHLGGGGFGQTFLAQDTHLPGNPLCVVKQLKPKPSDPATLQVAKRLFDREAETLYRLGHHDRIPRLLAHFEQESQFYLVEEFIEGQPLDQEFALAPAFYRSWCDCAFARHLAGAGRSPPAECHPPRHQTG